MGSGSSVGHVAGDLDREEDSGEPDHEGSRLPRPHVETERDARGGRVRGGTLECGPVAVDDELPDGCLALGDRDGDEEREDGETLEEHFGRTVVREADETIAEEGPRQEREDDDRGEGREAIDEPTCDEVRQGSQRASPAMGP